MIGLTDFKTKTCKQLMFLATLCYRREIRSRAPPQLRKFAPLWCKFCIGARQAAFFRHQTSGMLLVKGYFIKYLPTISLILFENSKLVSIITEKGIMYIITVKVLYENYHIFWVFRLVFPKYQTKDLRRNCEEISFYFQ